MRRHRLLRAEPAPALAEAKATLQLAWPLALTNLTQVLIHATDLALLGRLGADDLAAGALGVNVYQPFLVFSMGLVTAVAPLMARRLGACPHSARDLREIVRQGMWAAVMLATPMSLLLWNSELILGLLHQDPATSAEAARFVRALEWSLLPALFYMVLRCFVSALEKPVWSLLVGLGGVCVNFGFGYVLIFGKLGFPPLGAVGAGIGSTLTNLLMFIGLALVVVRHPRFRRYRLFGHCFRANWSQFFEIWRFGLPIAVAVALEMAIFNTATFFMGFFGTTALAAHAVAIQTSTLTFMVPLGVAQAATVRVSLAFGRQDARGVTLAGWIGYGLAVGLMSFMALLLLCLPELPAQLFLDAQDPANASVIQLSASFIIVAALFQIFDGAQTVGAGILRGLHDTTVPMIYAGIGYWGIGLGLGMTLAFGLSWGGIGIWIGLAAGLAVVAVLMLGRWLRRERIGLVPNVCVPAEDKVVGVSP